MRTGGAARGGLAGTRLHRRLRWGVALWMLVWAPVYAIVWGWKNFFALCDVAVFLGCFGMWRASPLLMSSQALPSIVVGVLWSSDLLGRVLAGRHPLGGTEYMFDRSVPLAVRLLSFFHLALPVTLIALLRRCGYDRRALALQAAVAAGVLVVSRALGGEQKNLNYAFTDPILRRSFSPAALHLTLVWAGMIGLVFLPTHLALRRLLPSAAKRR